LKSELEELQSNMVYVTLFMILKSLMNKVLMIGLKVMALN